MNYWLKNMGLDLSLLPIFNGETYSHSVLQCDRDQKLFEAIMSIEKENDLVAPAFSSYLSRSEGDPRYGLTTQTPYGEKIYFLPSKVLVNDELTDLVKGSVNIAIWRYLEALPWDTKIALFWH